jgi:hypothetical protein
MTGVTGGRYPLAEQGGLGHLAALLVLGDQAPGLRDLLARRAAQLTAAERAADDTAACYGAVARAAVLAARLTEAAADYPGGTLTPGEAAALILGALAGPDIPDVTGGLTAGCWLEVGPDGR